MNSDANDDTTGSGSGSADANFNQAALVCANPAPPNGFVGGASLCGYFTQALCDGFEAEPVGDSPNSKVWQIELFNQSYGLEKNETAASADLDQGAVIEVSDVRAARGNVVAEEIRSLQQSVSVADKARLEDYSTGVRSIEQQLQGTSNACSTPANPGPDFTALGDMTTVVRQGNLMWSLISAALACDLTRVVSIHYSGSSDCTVLPSYVYGSTSLYLTWQHQPSDL